MTAEPKIGRPRPKEVIARDKRVNSALRKMGKKEGVPMRELAEALDMTVSEVKYSLWRLRDQDLAERKNGYRWWPV